MSKVFRVSDRAGQDLDDIADYSIETWGIKQMESHMAMLDARFHWLAENPNLGQARPEIGPDIRGFVAGTHVIYYRGSRNAVEIVGVLHAARDAAKALKGPQ
ncbi:type II toxin-antitoxin system RelE/ParE family toxin [uncultured Sulfitobacter sp.]|uniref:type II toxin-antitoxin system RelE/ParE family toxin n=1 Tax=uncultured Sulfitobacter sp. TaxID=191468 RepID=UPI002609F0A2|nr:type II toxin-antitoxin system RelE/ParE family toxin [uncultured Sulfitobacter sp.]